jgi:hypothetical protein
VGGSIPYSAGNGGVIDPTWEGYFFSVDPTCWDAAVTAAACGDPCYQDHYVYALRCRMPASGSGRACTHATTDGQIIIYRKSIGNYDWERTQGAQTYLPSVWEQTYQNYNDPFYFGRLGTWDEIENRGVRKDDWLEGD